MVDRVMCESKRKGKERETETGKRLGAVRCGDGARLTQAHLPSCVCSLWSKQEKNKKKNKTKQNKKKPRKPRKSSSGSSARENQAASSI